MENLKQNLYMKHELRFNEAGKFKILMISDIQETCNYNKLTENGIITLLEREKPDLVVLGGDNVNGHKLKTIEELREYVKIMARPMEERRIPWAHVWGNHDHDTGIDENLQQKTFEDMPYCVSKTCGDIRGQSNFVLPIMAHDSDKIIFNVWGLDSGNLCPKGSMPENKITPSSSIFGDSMFDRVEWYYRSSKELEDYNNAKIAGLMCIHIAPVEILNTKYNRGACGTTGHSDEFFQLAPINSGLFAACLERGDVKAICSGHTHENDAEGKYMGISISNDGSIGYGAYGVNERRCGRVFEISESDPFNINTRISYVSFKE